MTTDALTHEQGGRLIDEHLMAKEWHRLMVPLGRVLFAAIFLAAGPLHFTKGDVSYAAAHGVPYPHLLVPLSGVLAIAGGLSVLLGYRARAGAWLLVLFLVPVTLIMHDFWAVKDAAMAQVQQAMFLKNLSMLGAALLLAHFGSGPLSLDSLRSRRRAANG
jgi:putative oxidoreductase